jgi:hypothetical protein
MARARRHCSSRLLRWCCRLSAGRDPRGIPCGRSPRMRHSTRGRVDLPVVLDTRMRWTRTRRRLQCPKISGWGTEPLTLQARPRNSCSISHQMGRLAGRRSGHGAEGCSWVVARLERSMRPSVSKCSKAKNSVALLCCSVISSHQLNVLRLF